MTIRQPIRNLSVMEALSVTGVAKALLAFYETARADGAAETWLATFIRRAPKAAPSPTPNAFIRAMEQLRFPVLPIAEKNAFDPASLFGLRRVIRQVQPDIIETHAVKSHVLMRLGRPRGVRWVAFHHGYTTPDRKMQLYNRLNPWALRGADLVVTVCRPFAEQLRREGVPRECIHVVPNAIQPFAPPAPEEAARLRTALQIAPNAFLFVSIGRLSAEKGHRYLVQAAAQGRGQAWAVLLVGDGPERAALEAQASSLGLQPFVKFAGHRPDPLPYYAVADAFVLPSLSEGSPLVLLEAMLARVPVIASQVGGIPETVENERSALLVPPQDPDSLAQAMLRMAADPALRERIRTQAFTDVQTRHTPDAYTSQVMELYRSLLRR